MQMSNNHRQMIISQRTYTIRTRSQIRIERREIREKVYNLLDRTVASSKITQPKFEFVTLSDIAPYIAAIKPAIG